MNDTPDIRPELGKTCKQTIYDASQYSTQQLEADENRLLLEISDPLPAAALESAREALLAIQAELYRRQQKAVQDATRCGQVFTIHYAPEA